MKSLIKLLLLVVLSVSAVSGSELVKVFGLKDQEFAEVTVKKLNRYKINDNLMITIRLSKTDFLDGYKFSPNYGGKNAGYLAGKFKKAYLENWVYLVDADFFTSPYYGKDRDSYITFTDENGLKMRIHMPINQVRIADKSININRRTSIKVVYTNKKLTVYVDERKLYSSSKRFGKLKLFEENFFDKGDNKYDVLVDTTLLEVK